MNNTVRIVERILQNVELVGHCVHKKRVLAKKQINKIRRTILLKMLIYHYPLLYETHKTQKNNIKHVDNLNIHK